MKKLALFVALCSVVSMFADCPGGVCRRDGYYGRRPYYGRTYRSNRHVGYYGPRQERPVILGVAYPSNDAAYGEGDGVQYYGPEAPAE